MDNKFRTALGTEVRVSFVEDCGDNIGGYYCEIYLNNEDDRCDDFVISKEQVAEVNNDWYELENIALKHISTITDY